MKWTILFLFSFLFSFFTLNGQAPLSFNYQAVARDAGGQVIIGQLSIRFKLHEDNALGISRYVETHTATTNDQGIFNLKVGMGTIVSGNFDLIDWAHHNYFIETEIKTGSGNEFISMGTSQLLSVPYAMYAATSGSSLDAGNGIAIQNNVITNTGDLSDENELQSLSLNGNQLSITEGNTVTLPTGTTYTEGAGIDINGNAISALDPSPTNEIQTLSLNGQQLSLSNGGGSVQLPGSISSWTTSGTVTHNDPITNDVAIGTDFNNNAKLNVSSSGAEHGGNFTSPGTGDALRSYCNSTGAGLRAGSLNGPGAVITTGAGDAGQFSSTSGKAGSFSSTTGTAGYFNSTNGNGLIVEHGKVGIGTTTPTRQLDVKNGSIKAAIPNEAGYGYPAFEAIAYHQSTCFLGEQYGLEPAAFFRSEGGLGLTLHDRAYGGKGTGLDISCINIDWNLYTDPSKDINFAYNGTLKSWIVDTDGSYHNVSDMRLKKDIKPLSNVLEGVSKLQAYTYHMLNAPDDSPLSVGFMAQEVEQQFPQMVVEKDGYKSLCYDQFAVLSIQAIKEQEVKIDTLEKKVTELEALLMEMKSLIAEKKN
jgi:hypothetical protein